MDLDTDLLVRLWPEERVLCGMRACRVLRRVLPDLKRVLLQSRTGTCAQATQEGLLRFRRGVCIVAQSYSANVVHAVLGAVRQGWGCGPRSN